MIYISDYIHYDDFLFDLDNNEAEFTLSEILAITPVQDRKEVRLDLQVRVRFKDIRKKRRNGEIYYSNIKEITPEEIERRRKNISRLFELERYDKEWGMSKVDCYPDQQDEAFHEQLKNRISDLKKEIKGY